MSVHAIPIATSLLGNCSTNRYGQNLFEPLTIMLVLNTEERQKQKSRVDDENCGGLLLCWAC